GRMLTGSLPLSPSRESLRASDRPANASAFTARNASQRFFSTRAQAGSFAQQGSRPASNQSNGRLDAQNGAQPNPRASGWQRFTGGANRSAAGDRPPLNLNKPVVNPNGASREPGRNAPAPKRPAPNYSNEPRSYRPEPTPAPAYRPAQPVP